ncbi:UDP-2,4-diacetamido-2,4,6-trideoxy-beta-L-altropyranose hydrolase [Pseudoalteromonas mariniglutinosa]|uniref:UDP-2,4-diacetamido-2,4, 6-trideoxy-beta-L-altropyranose hydrolase n=2 Tax=Pseudoalteromonas mariniglutinosa TaxID=206042 RepID=UPI00384AEC0E
MFAFRINCTQGIGHFMRCKWLAYELKKSGHDICFLLDDNPKMGDLIATLSWPVFTLPELSEQQDAESVLSLLETFQQPYDIVVDSYSLGIAWEKVIKAAGQKLIVIDDLAREHVCDYLIDQKFVTDQDNRYKRKLPSHCQSLLGPQFALLGPDYQQQHIIKNGKKQNILFSLGGGGDWRLLTPLIKECVYQFEDQLNVRVVIGPQAKHFTELLEFAEQHKQIEIIRSPDSLFIYYQQAALFVGALGTSLYELLATKTASLTFAIAKNQQNEQQDLQQLGHFFHVVNFLELSGARQIQLITTLLTHRNRVEGLLHRAQCPVDGYGVSRVVQCITGSAVAPIKSSKLFKAQPLAREKITAELSYRAVVDEDMMLYLAARNMPTNANKMTITSAIECDEHINWWFENQRQSYIIYANEQPIVFIWHQIFNVQEQPFLIGGWFTTGKKVDFPVALMILKWQLALTMEMFPGARWIAVINKENKFVRLLNQYMGFTDVPQESASFKAIQCAFPQASPQSFHYIERDPDLQVK